MKYIWKQSCCYGVLSVLAYSTIIVLAGLHGYVPLVTKMLVDYAPVGNEFEKFVELAAFVVLGYTALWATDILNKVVCRTVTEKIGLELRTIVANKLQKDGDDTSDAVLLCGKDTKDLMMVINQAFWPILGSILICSSILLNIVILNAKLSVLFLLTILPLAIINDALRRRTKVSFSQIRGFVAQENRIILRPEVDPKECVKAFEKTSSNTMKAQTRAGFFLALQDGLNFSLSGVMIGSFFVLVEALYGATNEISPGDFSALILYMQAFLAQFRTALTNVSMMQNFHVLIERFRFAIHDNLEG